MLGLPGIFVLVSKLKFPLLSKNFPNIYLLSFPDTEFLSPRRWRLPLPHYPVSLQEFWPFPSWNKAYFVLSPLGSQHRLLSSRLSHSHPQGHRSCNPCLSLILWIPLSLLDCSYHCMGMPKLVSSYIKKREEALHDGPVTSSCFSKPLFFQQKFSEGLSLLAVLISSLNRMLVRL